MQKKTENGYNALPIEIKKIIFTFFIPKAFAHNYWFNYIKLKQLSKEHQKVINQIVTEPEIVIRLISKLIPTSIGLKFIHYYRSTEQYKELIKKSKCPGKISEAELICCAIVSVDKDDLLFKRLQNTLDKINDSSISFYLNIMLTAYNCTQNNFGLGALFSPNPLQNYFFKKAIRLERLNLQGKSWVRLDLTGLNLNRMDLTGMDLSETNLQKVNMSDSNLTGVNLRRANITNTNFKNTTLKDVIFFLRLRDEDVLKKEVMTGLDYLTPMLINHPQKFELCKAIAEDIIKLVKGIKPKIGLEIIRNVINNPPFKETTLQRGTIFLYSFFKPDQKNEVLSGIEKLKLCEHELSYNQPSLAWDH